MESLNSMQQNGKRQRDLRQWSKEEDEALLDILIEAVDQGQRLDNGQFKAHTLETAEVKLEQKFPGCGIKVKPHIESAMDRLRTTYHTIYDILNQIGFGWDDEKKLIEVDDDVWSEYVKSRPNAKDFRYTQSVLLDKLAHAFGNDLATGKEAVTPADVVEEIDKEEEQNDGAVEVDLTHSPSINTSQVRRKQEDMESQPRKSNRGANLIANSISELGKNLGHWLEKSSERWAEVVNCLGVDKQVFDESRGLMDELKKMDLTELERFEVAEKILSMPYRLHIFWGCDDVHRLAYVKTLI